MFPFLCASPLGENTIPVGKCFQSLNFAFATQIRGELCLVFVFCFLITQTEE